VRLRNAGRDLCIHSLKSFEQSRDHLWPLLPLSVPDDYEPLGIDTRFESCKRRQPPTYIDNGNRCPLRWFGK
jgi:hypothetical protein